MTLPNISAENTAIRTALTEGVTLNGTRPSVSTNHAHVHRPTAAPTGRPIASARIANVLAWTATAPLTWRREKPSVFRIAMSCRRLRTAELGARARLAQLEREQAAKFREFRAKGFQLRVDIHPAPVADDQGEAFWFSIRPRAGIEAVCAFDRDRRAEARLDLLEEDGRDHRGSDDTERLDRLRFLIARVRVPLNLHRVADVLVEGAKRPRPKCDLIGRAGGTAVQDHRRDPARRVGERD